MCLFLQKNEMEKEYMKLQEAHEGQQALLQKLQVRSFRKQLREDLISKGRKEIQTSTRFASRLSKMWPLLDVAKFLSPPSPPPPPKRQGSSNGSHASSLRPRDPERVYCDEKSRPRNKPSLLERWRLPFLFPCSSRVRYRRPRPFKILAKSKKG